MSLPNHSSLAGTLWTDWVPDVSPDVCADCHRTNAVMIVEGETVKLDLYQTVELCRACYVRQHAMLCSHCVLWRAEEQKIRRSDEAQPSM